MSRARVLDFLVGVPLVKAIALFQKKREGNGQLKKVLLIKLAAAGDTILVGNMLAPFRAAHPGVRVDWLVSPINAEIAKLFSGVERLLVWSRKMSDLPGLIAAIRSEHYDAVIDLEQWSRGSGLISQLSGARERAGFDSPGQHRAAAYTKTFRKEFNQHEIEDFRRVLSLFGEVSKVDELELTVPADGKKEFEQLVPDSGRRTWVLVHPGCGWDGRPREWPLENYAVLLHWLIKTSKAEILLTSGPEEKEKTARLKKLLQNRAVDVGGRLSWSGLIAAVDAADLVLSGNTGVMHVAAALKKKQVALHGPTNPLLWGPLNRNAVLVQSDCPGCPCLKLGFEYHADDSSCMRQISVDRVKDAIVALI